MILRGLPFLLLLRLSPAVGAVESPEERIAVVSRVYGDFGGEKHPDLIDQPLSVLQRSFTPGLARLLVMEAKRRKGPPAELGHLDFEPLSGSQDPDIHDLRFRLSGHNTVMVLYRTSNGEKIAVLHHLHPVGGEWRIDDISYAKPPCSLRSLLNQQETRTPRSFTEPSLEAAPIRPLPSRATAPSRGELAKADSILNSRYHRLAAALGIDARERLIRAQRIWIRERDVFAAAYPLRREEALLQATCRRSEELAAILAGPVLPGR